jgi:protein-tyrosine phosphatase
MTPRNKPFRLLFVCMGNICRSPAADVVMRHLVAAAKLDTHIHVDSAGTIGYHSGKAPDHRMSLTLARRGYSPAGRARQVTAADLDAFDLILAMDDENLHDLHALDRSASARSKIRRFTDFCSHSNATHVPDPYYGGADGFEHVADLVEDGCAGILTWINQQPHRLPPS